MSVLSGFPWLYVLDFDLVLECAYKLSHVLCLGCHHTLVQEGTRMISVEAYLKAGLGTMLEFWGGLWNCKPRGFQTQSKPD